MSRLPSLASNALRSAAISRSVTAARAVTAGRAATAARAVTARRSAAAAAFAAALVLVATVSAPATAQSAPSLPTLPAAPSAPPAPASMLRTSGFEFRVPGGALVGTGTQRDLMKDAQVTAAQLSWSISPRLALTGTLAWGRSRDVAAIGTPKLDVYMYDLGVELRSAERWVSQSVSLRSFAGVGAGARSYNSRATGVDATSHAAGYAAVGGELGMRRVGVRLEVRDYATGMRQGASVGGKGAGNDLVVMASLRLNRRASAARQ